jgi:hypothetical protein
VREFANGNNALIFFYFFREAGIGENFVKFSDLRYGCTSVHCASNSLQRILNAIIRLKYWRLLLSAMLRFVDQRSRSALALLDSSFPLNVER